MTSVTKEYLDSLPEETILFIRDYIWNRFGTGQSEKTDDRKKTKENDLSSSCTIRTCPDCGSQRVIRWGKDKQGKQRYRCKDCSATFSDTSNTLLAWNHLPEEKLLQLIDCEIRGDTLSEISYQTKLRKNVCFNMRQRLHALASIKMAEVNLAGLIEMDATYTKINLSGTKQQNMPRISKKRGKNIPIVGEIKSLRGPNHHKICIATAVDEHDNMLFKVIGLGEESEEKYNKLGNRFTDGKTIVSDSCRSVINFAKAHGMKSDFIPTKPSGKCFTTPLGNSLGDVNELHQELKDLIRFSHGISTRHLPGYLDWISYTKMLHYTTPREDQARKVYKDLCDACARLKTKDICTANQPVNLYEAYGEYHYGIFAEGNLDDTTV